PLYFLGGPDMAPKPPSFGPPRRSRGAPLFPWGPRHGPQTPIVRAAPAEPWRPSISLGAPRWPPNPLSFGSPRRSRGAPLFPWGPRDGPQTPHRSGRPGGAVAPLYFTLTAGAPTWPPNPPAPAEPGRPSISGLSSRAQH